MHEYSVQTLQQLAHALRDRRSRRKKTQANVGLDVGVLPKTVSGLETKPGVSSIGTLFKLLSALELEMVLRPRENPSVASKLKRAEW